MTPKQVTSFDLTEIPALEVVCTCGSRIVIPIPKMDLTMHVSCVGCNKKLWDDQQDQTYIRVLGVLRSLTNWKTLAEVDKGFGLGFSLTSQ